MDDKVSDADLQEYANQGEEYCNDPRRMARELIVLRAEAKVLREDAQRWNYAIENCMFECPNCVTPWKCNGPHITGGPEFTAHIAAILRDPDIAMLLRRREAGDTGTPETDSLEKEWQAHENRRSWGQEERMPSVTMEDHARSLERINRVVSKELDAAKRVITWANNSLYGSHGYFLSTNGGAPDEHHLDMPIEKLKSYGHEQYVRAEAIKAVAEREAYAVCIAICQEESTDNGTAQTIEARIRALLPADEAAERSQKGKQP